MRSKARALIERVEGMRPREKILILASLLVLIVMLWDGMVRAPLAKTLKTRAEQRDTLRPEVEGYEVALQTIDEQAQRAGDPVKSTRKEIEKTKDEVRELDEQIKRMTASGVVEPSEMARALEQMLKLNTRLRLVSLRNLKSEPLLAGPEQAKLLGQPGGGTAAPGLPVALVYRHSFELELRGSYMDTLEYVVALEQLPWRLIWNELDIRIDVYPEARVRLVISTLSLEPGMLGV